MDLYRLSKEKHDLKILGFPLVLEEGEDEMEGGREGGRERATRLHYTSCTLLLRIVILVNICAQGYDEKVLTQPPSLPPSSPLSLPPSSPLSLPPSPPSSSLPHRVA